MYYAIGDIHGRADLLKSLYRKIIKDVKEQNDPFGNLIVFLGDYIDRGPASIAVMDFIMHLENNKELDIEHAFICGNHEMLMCQALHPTANSYERKMWIENGGYAVCEELNLTYFEIRDGGILQPWYDWIESHTKILINTPDYIFTLGGTQTHLSVNEQYPDACLCHRPSPVYYKDYPYMCIHGHTMMPKWGAPFKAFQDENRVCVDTGTPWSGVLTAVALPHVRNDEEIRFIAAKGPRYSNRKSKLRENTHK